MTLIGIILYSLFFGLLAAFLAERKGYDSLSWFWLGIFLGIIATGILLLQRNKRKEKYDASHLISR